MIVNIDGLTCMSDINRIKTSETLRTKGNITGNFGRPKVKAKPGVYEISKKTLEIDNLIIPSPTEYLTRLAIAYKTTDDIKLKKSILEIIRTEVTKR